MTHKIFYSMPKLTVTIPSGTSVSNTFSINEVNNVTVLAPVGLEGTATLNISIDGGLTWRNPTNTARTVVGGAVIDSNTMLPCQALFNEYVLWRINNSVETADDRVFTIFGTY